MYTLALRVFCPDGAIRHGINFEQESGAWRASKYSDDKSGDTADRTHGFYLYTPLTAVDMTPQQLAHLLATVEPAYNRLANIAYSHAVEDLRHSAYGNLRTFLDLFQDQPTPKPRKVADGFPGDCPNMPFLYNRLKDKYMRWDGNAWVLLDARDVVRTNDHCTGYAGEWEVYYNEAMTTDPIRDPAKLRRMVLDLFRTVIKYDSTKPDHLYLLHASCIY